MREITFLSVERTVEEGILIALTAVRMAVKNQIILGVLKDKTDFQVDDYAEVARGQLALLVAENDGHAKRFHEAALAPLPAPLRGDPDFGAAETKRLQTLEQVHTGLTVALRTFADDEAKVLGIVESARHNAWDEIGDAWIAKLTAELPEPLDEAYRWQRAGRLQEFVYIDLAGLMHDHPTSLD
jgi:hypothetical protein